MADWMAHRFGQSPIYRIAIGSGDAELLATVMADLMAEYLAEIGYDARCTPRPKLRDHSHRRR